MHSSVAMPATSWDPTIAPGQPPRRPGPSSPPPEASHRSGGSGGGKSGKGRRPTKQSEKSAGAVDSVTLRSRIGSFLVGGMGSSDEGSGNKRGFFASVVEASKSTEKSLTGHVRKESVLGGLRAESSAHGTTLLEKRVAEATHRDGRSGTLYDATFIRAVVKLQRAYAALAPSPDIALALRPALRRVRAAPRPRAPPPRVRLGCCLTPAWPEMAGTASRLTSTATLAPTSSSTREASPLRGASSSTESSTVSTPMEPTA